MLRTKGRRKKYTPSKDVYRINLRIRVPEVRVIDETGQQIGVMKTSQALVLAEEKGLDLVEVFPKSVPPVCKLLDYGQYQYQLARKVQDQKAKVKKVETKGIRISYKIGQHDLDFRKDQALKFLSKGDKVKIEMILKGREKKFNADAFEKMNDFIKLLAQDAKFTVEQPLKRQGGQIFTLITPTPAQ
ncbi:MAG: translation initiation factor IF-3 [Patescibacteria group bacterium]|jgi:translation initiation factor IF-3